MVGRRISYTFDGDTFVGCYQVHEDGQRTSVLVEFGQATACTNQGTQPEEQVARALLGRLVREKLAASSHTSRVRAANGAAMARV